MTFQVEFPDFPAADMPAIPSTWEDTSWRNESSPSFKVGGCRVWVDWVDPAARDEQMVDLPRFAVYPCDETGAHLELGDEAPQLATDDWNEVLAFVLGETFAAKCRETFEEAELAEIRRRNTTPEYSGDTGPCATHDFADANMIMLEAFEEAFGREPLYLEGTDADGNWTTAQEADLALWNAAWTRAKKAHLTAAEGEQSPIDQLTDEYGVWLAANGLPEISADEHDPHALTMVQREWIADFCERWDAAQKAEDKR